MGQGYGDYLAESNPKEGLLQLKGTVIKFWVSLENFYCEMWVDTAEIKWGSKLVGGLKDELFFSAI